jgi:hypothetical protein
MKININKNVHTKGFNNMYIKGLEKIDKKIFVNKVLLEFNKQKIKNNT